MSDRRLHVILNPTAGSGAGAGIQPVLASEIPKRFGPGFSLSVTTGPNEATRLAHDAISHGATLVVACGGDGTVQEVVNGMFDNGRLLNPGCELGIVDCGTGRGLADSLGLPTELADQLDLVRDGPAVAIDVGRVCYVDRSGIEAVRLFVNECQLGIGGAVVERVGLGHKRLGGTIGFGIAAVGELARFRCPELDVQIDEKPPTRGRFLGVMIGNGARCAGGMQLTPEARPDDGVLDVVLVGEMGVLRRLWVFPKIYRGRHTGVDLISSHRCRRVRITGAEPVPLEADGELLGHQPCSVEVLPAALRVRAPQKRG